MPVYPCHNYYYRQNPQSYCTFAALLSEYSPILSFSFCHAGDMDLPYTESNNAPCDHTECIIPIYNRATKEVDRIAHAIYDKLTTINYELSIASVDSRLFMFLIKSMVSFFNENEESYEGTGNERINEALRDLRKQKPWIMEVLQMYNLSPSALNKILRNITAAFFDETGALYI